MSEDLQAIIDEAVKKALAGDDEAINGIEDRVTRAKAKAALVKAKREQPKAVEGNTPSQSNQEQSEAENSENITCLFHRFSDLILVEPHVLLDKRFIIAF